MKQFWRPAQLGTGGECGVQIFCALSSSLAYLCIGLVRSWASTGLPSLNDAANNTNPAVLLTAPLSEDTTSWIVSLPPMGAILGSCLSSLTLNWAGRKCSIILSGVMFFLSFLLIGLASIPSSVEMIITGRALSGIGVGLAVPSAAIYVAECSSPALRGTLSSLPAFLMAFGVLLGYVFGIFLPWHHLAYFCCTPAVLLVLAMMFLPDTPLYLASKGETEKAAKSLAWLRGTSVEAVSQEISSMSCGVEGSTETTHEDVGLIREFFSCPNLHPLLLTFVLHFLQNWSGVNVIVFKTVHVFETVGSSIDKYVCTAIVGGVQLVSTGLSVFLVDRAGRRPLLMISGLVMTISMGSLAAFLYFQSSIPDSWRWLPLVSIIGSFIGYSVGYASIPFIIMGEMLPARTRSVSGALSSTFNLTCLFLVLKFYTNLAEMIEYHGVYWLFTAVNMFGVIFVFCFLPETKGKSLQEIEEIFAKKKTVNSA
eukprot:GFUD01052267.1.p1 GENE.GFUD01052267.1~~GFUD01052267.1.p1  ORF type:complete len:481 (-),score=118.98 GFUD01052267.1:59-1501(-)